MDSRLKLESSIDDAWNVYSELHKEESQGGYDDAMDGFERKEAEGFALGLEAAYTMIYGQDYQTKVHIFDPYCDGDACDCKEYVL